MNKKESLNKMIYKTQDVNSSKIVDIEETCRSFTDIEKNKKEKIIDYNNFINKN